MSQALQAVGCHYKSYATAIFINQIREKVGLSLVTEVTRQGPEVYSSVRLEIRRIESLNRAMNSWEQG